jgi:hypothetical protein
MSTICETQPAYNNPDKPTEGANQQPVNNDTHTDTHNFKGVAGEQISRALTYVRSNPTYVGTLLYLTICFLGLVYNQTVFAITGLNPTLYFDVSDFILSGLRHPVVLVTPIVLAGFVVAGRDLLLRHKDNIGKKITRYVGYFVAVFVAGCVPILTAYLKVPACGQEISINFDNENSGTPNADWSWLLYGTTSKFIFAAHEVDDKQLKYVAIPFDKISKMTFRHTLYQEEPYSVLCKIVQ